MPHSGRNVTNSLAAAPRRPSPLRSIRRLPGWLRDVLSNVYRICTGFFEVCFPEFCDLSLFSDSQRTAIFRRSSTDTSDVYVRVFESGNQFILLQLGQKLRHRSGKKSPAGNIL